MTNSYLRYWKTTVNRELRRSPAKIYPQNYTSIWLTIILSAHSISAKTRQAYTSSHAHIQLLCSDPNATKLLGLLIDIDDHHTPNSMPVHQHTTQVISLVMLTDNSLLIHPARLEAYHEALQLPSSHLLSIQQLYITTG